LPLLSGDAPLLTQVFVNLLANANKFAPAGSTISVGGEVTATEIAISVRDEGPGLPEDFEDMLFEPFVRAAAEEPAEPGIGLGLYIVHSIVTRHGGRVVAQNAHPGTRVTVRLPRGEPR
jgi:two-component system sensor histidine kinase KdpD